MENGEPEKTSDELRQDLTQLEDEINTLKQVLHVKVSFYFPYFSLNHLLTLEFRSGVAFL